MFTSEGTVSRTEGAAVQKPAVGACLLEPAGFEEQGRGLQGQGRVGRSGGGEGENAIGGRCLRTLRHVVRTQAPLCRDDHLAYRLPPLPGPSSALAAGFLSPWSHQHCCMQQFTLDSCCIVFRCGDKAEFVFSVHLLMDRWSVSSWGLLPRKPLWMLTDTNRYAFISLG